MGLYGQPFLGGFEKINVACLQTRFKFCSVNCQHNCKIFNCKFSNNLIFVFYTIKSCNFSNDCARSKLSHCQLLVSYYTNIIANWFRYCQLLLFCKFSDMRPNWRIFYSSPGIASHCQSQCWVDPWTTFINECGNRRICCSNQTKSLVIAYCIDRYSAFVVVNEEHIIFIARSI